MSSGRIWISPHLEKKIAMELLSRELRYLEGPLPKFHNPENELPSAYLLALLLPATASRDMIANLEELYREIWLPRFGEKKARRVWWSQSFQLIAGRWITLVLDILDRIKTFRVGRD